jgi:hypothetical protein
MRGQQGPTERAKWVKRANKDKQWQTRVQHGSTGIDKENTGANKSQQELTEAKKVNYGGNLGRQERKSSR